MTTERMLGQPGGQENAPKPDTISERKLLNIIAAVGNHEAKALLLVLMKDDVIYTPVDLATLLNGSQERQRGWKRGGVMLWRYCEDSLEQIGLVVQKPTIRDTGEEVGYIKTEAGKTWGNIVAASMLQLSARQSRYSLVDIMGPTSSSSQKTEVIPEGDDYRKRAVSSRLKIYRALLGSMLPIRQSELLETAGFEQGMVYAHLRNMGELGLIGYESKKPDRPFVFYQLAKELPKSEPGIYRTYKKMTNFVFGLLKDNPQVQWTRDAVAEKYVQVLGERSKDFKLESYSTNASGVLKHLDRQGFVRHGKFSGDKHSEISLSSGQRELLLDIVGTIDAVWRQDEQVTRSAHEYISHLRSHQEEVSNLMIKAREHSSAAGQRPISETNEKLVYLATAYPSSDAQTLRELLEKEGTKLGRARVVEVLRELAKVGRLRVEKVKCINHYSVAGRE